MRQRLFGGLDTCGQAVLAAAAPLAKAALVGLVDLLRRAGSPERRILDAQWLTPHLESLGAVEVTRAEYRGRLETALVVEAAL